MARTKAQDVMVLALGSRRSELTQRIAEIQQNDLSALLDELADVESQLQAIDVSIPPVPVASTLVVTATELSVSRSKIGASSNNNHLRMTSTEADTAGRMHFEPNGRPAGTASKSDWMLDPYDLDPTNYRHSNIYTKTYDPADIATQQGDNGVIVWGGKAVGDFHGIFPVIHFAFSDDGIGGAVPGKLCYFDTSDTVWRTPMKGAWRGPDLDVTTGEYRLAGSKLYQAQNSGLTGSTKPTHLSGTVSDGAIDWLFIRNFAAAAASIKGCWLFGDRDSMPKFGWPNVRVQYAKDFAMWQNARMQFADVAGALAWSLYPVTGTDDVRLESNDGRFVRYSKTGKYIQTSGLADIVAPVTMANGDATPSIAGVRMLQAAGSAPITSFTGGAPNQSFVFKGNGTVTLTHNSNIVLNTGANKTPANGKILRFWTNGAGTMVTEEG